MLNPNLFFYLQDRDIVLWNYEAQTQFQIEPAYLDAIVQVAAGNGDKVPDAIMSDLRENNVVVESTSLPQEWAWDRLAQIYHFGTQMISDGKPIESMLNKEKTYLEYCADITEDAPPFHLEYDGAITSLPPPDLDSLNNTSLWNVLTSRLTSRQFDETPLRLADFSTLLYTTFFALHGAARNDVAEHGFETVGYRRTSPAAGGLQSPEPYILVRNVEGLNPGLYHYSSAHHHVVYLGNQFEKENLGLLLGGQLWANDLAAGIFIVSNIDRLAWKYPNSRSYRVSQIDIGALLQTFQLTCTALGVSSWPTGYFLDRELDRLLTLDRNKQLTTFFFGVGTGSPRPISKRTIALGNEAAL